MIFSLMYIILCVPGSYILDKLGLRISILIGIVGTCIGSWIKVIAVHPDRFWLALIGQVVIAACQVLVLPIPPKLAAVWFGPNEVAFACTLGAVSLKFGLALGFLIPPLTVKQGDTYSMQDGLYAVACGYAVASTVIIAVLYFLLDDAPQTPPSFAQHQVQEKNKIAFNYKASLVKLLKNRSFVFLLFLYGSHLGSYVAIAILLNQLILSHYPDAAAHVGILGLINTFAGIVGSVVYGVLISKYGGLKFITRFLFGGATIATFMYVFLIDQGLLIVYICGIISAIFLSSIFCVGFELGSELTYPEPEAASGGLLTISYQIFSMIGTYVFSYFYNNVSNLAGNLCVVVILLLANILLFFIRFDLKRSGAEKLKQNLNLII